MEFLTYLVLGGNNFSGSIPESIGDLQNIYFINISYNQLYGEIPESICNLGLDWGQWGDGVYNGISNNNLCPPYPDCGDGPITSEDEQDVSECPPLSISELTLPIEYSLNQPFPNSFNPTATISFSIPQPDMVSINIYDINGKLITTLINKQLPVGYHSIDWDGSNYSSGVYIIKLSAANFSTLQKVILLK